MVDVAFKKKYGELNIEQKRAVDTIEGPVMVMAGPGTGKTQVLACRIANILATQDVEPGSILALTFTDAAAKNMRERVVSLIGTTGYGVAITTFHSFCREVIDTNPEYIAVERSSQPLTDLERYGLVEELIVNTKLTALKPLGKTLHYLPQVLSSISHLKRENFSPERFESLITAEEIQFEQEKEELKKSELVRKQKDLEKQRELLTLYTKYQSKLVEKNRYDFDDMIAFVLQAFEANEELLLTYQEKFQYVLVDEFQDTNASQNRVVDLLLSYWGEAANLFVVGDPHQSIFRFQGASVENMLGFLERYPTATSIALEKGYRCPQIMYDAAHALISNNAATVSSFVVGAEAQHRVQKAVTTKLVSSSTEKGALEVYEAPTVAHEVAFIVSKIKLLLSSNVTPEKIAVLYKNHSDVTELVAELVNEAIPCKADIGDSIFDDSYILQLLALCELIASVSTTFDDGLLFKVLLYDWLALDRSTVFILQRASVAGKIDLNVFLRKDAVVLSQECGVDVGQVTAMQTVLRKLEFWHAQAYTKLFHVWFSELISDTHEQGFGFFNWIATKVENKQHILALTSLFEEVKAWVTQDASFTVFSFLDAVAVIRKNALPLKVQALSPVLGAVTISSVHKAKGQEWEHVFVMRLRDKKWGNARKKTDIPLPASMLRFVDVEHTEKNEDDRRLFYVAITRAKKATYLSYPQAHTVGGSTSSYVKSMFLTEISEYTAPIIASESANVDELVMQKKLSIPIVGPTISSQKERAFFASLVGDFKLSVTALNAYLEDPKKFVWQSLLRVPKVKEGYLSYGTAMHAALESWYKKVQPDGKVPDKSYLLTGFTMALQRETLLTEEKERWLDKGTRILEQYHSAHSVVQKPVATEFIFGSHSRPVVLESTVDPITVVGRVDRIDLLDANKKQVRVVDYKTGKIRTKNDIEGKTKTSQAKLSPRELQLPEPIRSSYKRQLVFYKMLAELDPSFPYTVTEVAFEFLEPKEAGGFATERFTIENEEVAALKTVIIEVMTEIRNLAFLEELDFL